MAENLQNLLERIQKEGVHTAEQKADQIIKDAEAKAQSILNDAKTQAQSDVAKAETEAKSFDAHAKQSIQQAARDVVLSVQQQIDKTLQSIVRQNVSEALSADGLKDIVLKVTEAYAKGLPNEARIEVLLSEDERRAIGDALVAEFGKSAQTGLTVSASDTIISGFSLSVVDGNVEHDFSGEAVTEALCALLRPRLAELIREL